MRGPGRPKICVWKKFMGRSARSNMQRACVRLKRLPPYLNVRTPWDSANLCVRVCVSCQGVLIILLFLLAPVFGPRGDCKLVLDIDVNMENDDTVPGEFGWELGLHGLGVVHGLVLQPRHHVAHRPLPPHCKGASKLAIDDFTDKGARTGEDNQQGR
jgi:hypothetical protein